MKKTLTVSVSLFICMSCGSLFAQEKASTEIKKEVLMEEENGEKTLTITTTENGTVTEEKYVGEEAESKMAELSEGELMTDKVTKEVEVVEVNGEKKVTVTTSTNGKMREEVYTGEDAERIITEMESEPSETKEMKTKTVIIKEEKTVRKSEN